MHRRSHSIGQDRVDATAYHLQGLLFSKHSSLWAIQSKFSYTSVLGSSEWIYPTLLGCWCFLTHHWLVWATYWNATLAGIFPAASYAMTYHLINSKRIATIAALFTLIDPATGVNATWLLKDTLACFLVTISAWAIIRIMKMPNKSAVLIAGFCLSCLSAVKFVGYITFF